MRRRLAALVPLLFAALLAPSAGATAAGPNDPLFAATETYRGQWGLEQIRAPQAWATADGTGAVIAVIDSGVDLTHPDLQGKLVPGRSFDCTGDACNDGGAFEDEGPSPFHGTYVAGLAAAATGNGIGIAGVAPGATILPLDVRGATVNSPGHIAQAIRWAADHGADVVNLSIADIDPLGQLLVVQRQSAYSAAIAYAHQRDVVVVAAAGNQVFPLCASPAYVEGVLCVAGTDRSERPAAYSNLAFKGRDEDRHTVRAPSGGAADGLDCGGLVVSTVPAGYGDTTCDYPTDGAGEPLYGQYAGTSAAAPHVAGVAALLKGLGCSRVETIDLIEQTAREVDGDFAAGWDPVYGWGIVDASAAVAAALTACA